MVYVSNESGQFEIVMCGRSLPDRKIQVSRWWQLPALDPSGKELFCRKCN